ncbi:MAG: adenylate/guanylate cyclase domain-containing protein, partial [Pseudomonadota bacterium]
MSDLENWLKSIGLDEYAEKFAENRIGVDILRDLTEADLEKLDIPLGDRKRLLRAAAFLNDPDALIAPSVPRTLTNQVERRQLTVMFVDLVGSTALSERLDLDEFRTVIKAFNETVKTVLRQHDGFMAQIQGDGVLAYFGYPRAKEDDPDRAVAAGLSVARAVEGIELELAISLKARVGMATGLVAVGDLIGEGIADRWTATGETANLAARLQSLAEPGSVLVDEVTRKLIGKGFLCDDFGTKFVKGFSEAIQVWRVRKRQLPTTRFESYRHEQLTPFINREEEIQLLHHCWTNTKEASGQSVLISGEPGIGKSRLAKTFCDQISAE